MNMYAKNLEHVYMLMFLIKYSNVIEKDRQLAMYDGLVLIMVASFIIIELIFILIKIKLTCICVCVSVYTFLLGIHVDDETKWEIMQLQSNNEKQEKCYFLVWFNYKYFHTSIK